MKSYLIFHGYFKTSLHFYFSAQNQLRIKFAENCFQFTFFFIRSNIILEILSPFIFPIVIFKQISTVLLPSICYNFCPTSFRTSSIIFFDHSTSDGNILTNVVHFTYSEFWKQIKNLHSSWEHLWVTSFPRSLFIVMSPRPWRSMQWLRKQIKRRGIDFSEFLTSKLKKKKIMVMSNFAIKSVCVLGGGGAVRCPHTPKKPHMRIKNHKSGEILVYLWRRGLSCNYKQHTNTLCIAF